MKTVGIQSRRYFGSKYKLIPFIRETVDGNCTEVYTVADIFAGTGAVSSGFQDKQLITNDILYSNYITHTAWFGTEICDEGKIVSYLEKYNAVETEEANYMTVFADTYFSRADCCKIGFIREDIEREYHSGRLNTRERAVLLTSLLYGMDRIANTCGHYETYIRKTDFSRGQLELYMPLLYQDNNSNNQCFQMDANDVVKQIQADLVYIDPPYNSRQYCDSYHLPENVMLWQKPEVYGVTKKMKRTGMMKSRYCRKNAVQAFAELIHNIRARYILLSYSNVGEKLTARSNAAMKDEEILEIMQTRGTVAVFEKDYKAFSTGKTRYTGNKERLFLCTCK